MNWIYTSWQVRNTCIFKKSLINFQIIKTNKRHTIQLKFRDTIRNLKFNFYRSQNLILTWKKITPILYHINRLITICSKWLDYHIRSFHVCTLSPKHLNSTPRNHRLNKKTCGPAEATSTSIHKSLTYYNYIYIYIVSEVSTGVETEADGLALLEHWWRV